jgi:hypothetical protein
MGAQRHHLRQPGREYAAAAARVDNFMAQRGRDGFADTIKPWSMARTGGAEAFKEVANYDDSYENAAKENAEKK